MRMSCCLAALFLAACSATPPSRDVAEPPVGVGAVPPVIINPSLEIPRPEVVTVRSNPFPKRARIFGPGIQGPVGVPGVGSPIPSRPPVEVIVYPIIVPPSEPIPSISQRIVPSIPNPVDTNAVLSNGDYYSALGFSGAFDDIIAKGKLHVVDNRIVDAMPKFLTGLDYAHGFEPSPNKETVDGLKANTYPIETIRITSVKDLNADEDSAADLLNYIATAPDNKRFIVWVDESVFRPNVAKVLNDNDHIIMFICGGGSSSEANLKELAVPVAATLAQRAFLRKISNKPIFLEASALNAPSGGTSPNWGKAFGDDINKFDGFAIYNLPTFNSFIAQTRKNVCENLGLPQNSKYLLSTFIGTTKQTDMDRKAWDQKFAPLVKKLRDQGWCGITLLATTEEDRKFKENFLKTIPADTKFEQ